MSAMTPERLAEVRWRANLQCGLDGDDADDLLIHVDHLTAEVDRLRLEVSALRDVATCRLPHDFRGLCPDPDQPESRDPDCSACAALLNLTEGETDE